MHRQKVHLVLSLALLIAALAPAILTGAAQAAEEGRSGPNPLWDYRYNGPGAFGNSDIGKAICQGPDGNLYCTGQASVDSSSGSDLVVLSVTPGGAERWVYLYDAGNGFDMAYAIAADAAGNVYAAGDSALPGTNSDFTVVSLDSNGKERWVYRKDGGAHDLDSAFAIAVGTDGNIYAGGICTFDKALSYDMYLVSLTPDGAERWTYRYSGPAGHGDVVWSVAAGADGNIYVAGSACIGFWDDFVVASFTPEGGVRWAYAHNGSANGEDAANQVIWGSDGNLYAVGKTTEVGKSRDLAVVSLTPAGQERWVYLYNGPLNSHDVGLCITWGSDGNLYAGGKTIESGGDSFAVISLTPGGTKRWAWLPTWDGYNGVYSIATDSEANVYACGWIGEKFDVHPYYAFSMALASVNSEGAERWKYVYRDPDTLVGVCDQLVWDEARQAAYAVGMTNSETGGVEFGVIAVGADPVPDLTVALTPYDPPIVIPPGGGDFWYNAAAANNETVPVALDAWITATLPGGAPYPLLGPYPFLMQAGGNAGVDLHQYVPGFAPAGTYSVNLYAGEHPGTVWDSDSFTFEKL